LFVELSNYFRANKIGEALNPENLYALSPDTRRAPDLAVVLGDRRALLRGATVIRVIPDIVVEVISPSETPRAIHRKLRQYFEAGVKEAWLVYPESRTIEIWTGLALPTTELAEGDKLNSPLLPGFALPIAELFA
jgi:Uma2 family endonuclease